MAEEKATPIREDEIDDIRVTLELDDGEAEECKILTIFDLDDQDYIALMPLTEDGEDNPDGDVYLYRYYEDEEEIPHLENITDSDEIEAVMERFDEILEDDDTYGLVRD